MRSRGLLSWPFLCLYGAAVLAVVLDAGRSRWGSMGWYPLAVGGTAALAIIPLRHMLARRLLDRSAGDWLRMAFFFSLAVLTFAAGVFFMKADEGALGCGMLLMTVLFSWGALGTMLQWPGFRRPPKPNECPTCRYDLTGNTSGVCPECGTPFDSIAED